MKTEVPFKDLVHLLNGHESSFFDLDGKFWQKLDRNAFLCNLLEQHEIEQIKRIGLIAVQYKTIQDYLEKQKSDLFLF